MKMFIDIFSGANVASDAFPHEICYNGAAIKFTAKFITKVDNLGALPAGEGDEEGAEPQGETVIDVVDAYNLHTVEGYTAKEWMAGVVKPTMAKIMEKLKEEGSMDEEETKSYKKGCVEFVNFVKGKFKEIQIYQGDIGEYVGEAQSFGYALNENPDEPLELSIYFFKGGLKEEKY